MDILGFYKLILLNHKYLCMYITFCIFCQWYKFLEVKFPGQGICTNLKFDRFNSISLLKASQFLFPIMKYKCVFYLALFNFKFIFITSIIQSNSYLLVRIIV